MATYGPNSGTVPFTGWSPTLGVGSATTGAASGTVMRNGMTNDDAFIAKSFLNRAGRVTRELLLTLLGAAAGGSASDTYKRVYRPVRNSDPQEYGGLATVETVTLVSRVTTATDTTNITALLSREPKPSSYPTDLSGNGGGGKAGY